MNSLRPGLISRSRFPTLQRMVLEAVAERLAQIDPFAPVPLSRRFADVVSAFAEAGETYEVRYEVNAARVELRLSIDLDLRDLDGDPLPEVCLQYATRARNSFVRAAHGLFGSARPARVLVLTPRGYRLTQPHRLDAERFLPTGRPRLAAYEASSIPTLGEYLELCEGHLSAAAGRHDLAKSA